MATQGFFVAECLSPDANIFLFQKLLFIIQWGVWPEKWWAHFRICDIATAIFLQQLGGARELDSSHGPILEFSPQLFALKENKEIKRMKINQTKKKDLQKNHWERLILKQFHKKIRSKPKQIACNLRTQKSNNYTTRLHKRLCPIINSSYSATYSVTNYDSRRQKTGWSMQNHLENKGKKPHKTKRKQ